MATVITWDVFSWHSSFTWTMRIEHSLVKHTVIAIVQQTGKSSLKTLLLQMLLLGTLWLLLLEYMLDYWNFYFS